jgi:N-acetylglucosamine-6-sulfatase
VGFGCADDDGDGAATAERAAQEERVQPEQPNLVVVMTDDQTLSAFNGEAMPFSRRFFKRAGGVFANALSIPPLCCPARAGFLTGQYAHNHGVLTNVPGYSELRDKGDVLPAWLRRAGYRTGVVGKFMNGYPGMGLEGPPGWDHWFIAVGAVDYFDFEVSTAGELRRFDDGQYATDVYTDEANRFVRRAGRDEEPFFLWLSYNAPHIVEDAPPPCAGKGPEPANRRDYERFADAELPRPPQFDEEDVDDKGPWVQAQPRMSSRRLEAVTQLWRCTLASLRAVDRGLRSLVDTLRGLETLDDTVIVFVSDNGYFFGEHRIRDNKRLPYDAALRVPLAIHVPGNPRAGTDAEVGGLVSTVDLAPTLLDYAGARPCLGPGRCRVMDGRSLRPLLAGETESWPSDRAIPIELADSIEYSALRTPDHLYIELEGDYRETLPTPQIELYDLQADPAQLRNLWREDRAEAAPVRAELADRLRTLSRCAGTRPGDPRACE